MKGALRLGRPRHLVWLIVAGLSVVAVEGVAWDDVSRCILNLWHNCISRAKAIHWRILSGDPITTLL
jgi:hypothetical protein